MARVKRSVHSKKRRRATLAKAAEEFADKLQGEELAQHEKADGKFGWEYVPSRTLVTARQMHTWRIQEELSGAATMQLLRMLGAKI